MASPIWECCKRIQLPQGPLKSHSAVLTLGCFRVGPHRYVRPWQQQNRPPQECTCDAVCSCLPWCCRNSRQNRENPTKSKKNKRLSVLTGGAGHSLVVWFSRSCFGIFLKSVEKLETKKARVLTWGHSP